MLYTALHCRYTLQCCRMLCSIVLWTSLYFKVFCPSLQCTALLCKKNLSFSLQNASHICRVCQSKMTIFAVTRGGPHHHHPYNQKAHLMSCLRSTKRVWCLCFEPPTTVSLATHCSFHCATLCHTASTLHCTVPGCDQPARTVSVSNERQKGALLAGRGRF